MPGLSKKLAVAMLGPLARGIEVVNEPLIRAWSHARLSARLGYPVNPSVVVLGLPEIRGTGRLQLGRELLLYRELYLETQATGTIVIGDRVVISRGSHLVAFAGITIGDGAMIGEYVSIRDANHRVVPGQPLREAGYLARPIDIGREAWIGRGAAILAGVTVGQGAVVGANAVVTRDVAAGSRVGGVPARLLAPTVKVGGHGHP